MDILSPFQIALSLLVSFEPELMGIIGLSLGVSLTAVVLSLVIGLPLGALLAAYRFPGRSAIIVISNTFLGMPPVVVGLVIYLLVSRAGPFGFLGILYTPAAMMLAQTILVLPIAIALSRQVFEALNAGDPLHMGESMGWDEEQFRVASHTTTPQGKPYANLCIGCDRFHEEMLGPVIREMREKRLALADVG